MVLNAREGMRKVGGRERLREKETEEQGKRIRNRSLLWEESSPKKVILVTAQEGFTFFHLIMIQS